MAADSAVMLIDVAKGVEAQTKKLFRVCKERGIPIFTFVNKIDHFGRNPFDLMDEIEDILGIHAYPMNWPIGLNGNYQASTTGLRRLSNSLKKTRPTASANWHRPKALPTTRFSRNSSMKTSTRVSSTTSSSSTKQATNSTWKRSSAAN